MIPINSSLKRDEVRSLQPKKDPVTGKPGLCYEQAGPNRASRRSVMQARKSGNAKNTASRRVQYAPITVKKETKFGTVNEPTGFVRKIIHSITESKLLKFALAKSSKMSASKNPLKSNTDVALEKTETNKP